VKQQIREATEWGMTPRFLIHDNDGIFGQYGKRVAAEQNDSTRSYRCHLDRWLNEVMEVEGLPIPCGAPNASPHVERIMRTLREEALDHFIFVTDDHIRRVVAEHIRYYNGAPIAGDPCDPGSVSGTAAVTAAGRQGRGSAGPRWCSARLSACGLWRRPLTSLTSSPAPAPLRPAGQIRCPWPAADTRE
jgi:hypothetical protein